MKRALVAVALFGALTGAARAAPDQASQRVQEAASALMMGNPTQAVEHYSDALKDATLTNDRRAVLLNDRAVAYARLGQTRQALEDYNRSVQLYPENPAVYNNRGSLLLALGLAKESLKDFDRAILLAPGYAAAYNNRAGAHMRLGSLEDAHRDYSRAVQLVPSNPSAMVGRGRTLLAMHRPHAAMRDFSRAVQADQRFASGYRGRAEAKLDVESFEDAIEDLSRAIVFDAGNAEIHILRGRAHLAVKNAASAIKDFSRAVELDPRSLEALLHRGLAHGMAETFDEAMADLNKVIDLDPRSALAYAYRGWVYKESGQADVGEKDIQTAMKLEADRPEVLWAKAAVDEALGRTDQAIADLRRALTLRPGYKLASDALQRLGAPLQTDLGAPVADAGIDRWVVMRRGSRYVAVHRDLAKVQVPLEMQGEGVPKLLEWEERKPPLKGFGVLRFFAGKAGNETTELAAIVDLNEAKVIAIELHRQGDKVATWTWEEGKVVVASADGATDEFVLRAVKPQIVSRSSPGPSSEQGGLGWAPWDQPWGGPPSTERKAARAPQRSKPKTLFELLFSN